MWLQLITMSHDRYMAAIPTIQASYLKSQKVQQRLQLKATTQRQGHPGANYQRLPKNFHQEGEGMPGPDALLGCSSACCWTATDDGKAFITRILQSASALDISTSGLLTFDAPPACGAIHL